MSNPPRTICFCTNTDEEVVKAIIEKHRKKQQTMGEMDFCWFIWEQCAERLKKKPVQRCGKCIDRIRLLT